MKGKKVLVTGGAGFIGSNIVHYLSSSNEVVVLDDFSTGKKENLEGFDGTIMNGDIRHLKNIPKDLDYALHLAAFVSVPGSVLDPDKNASINMLGTQNLLTVAKDSGLEKVVFASSAAVYGDVPEDQLPVTEDMDLRPASPYAGSKMTAEDTCMMYNDMFDLRVTALRPFNVYGPRQDPRSEYAAVIPAFIEKVMNDEPPVIYGDGEQTRDFVFVEDVARAFERAAETKESDGKRINVASGKAISMNELARTIIELAGKDLGPVHEDPRPGDIKHSVASVEEAKRILDWEARTPLTDGLKATIDWFR